MSAFQLGIIGNSHTVAVKEGWAKAGAVTSGFEPHYFVTRGDFFTGLKKRGNKLVAVDPDTARQMQQFSGTTEIDVSRFDAFLLVGLSISIQTLSTIYASHRLPGHGERQYVISRAALGAALRDNFARSAAVHVMRQLRAISDAPIVLSPQPLLSTNVFQDEDGAAFWQAAHVTALYDVYRAQTARVTEGLDAQLLFQPDDTIVAPAFTDARYSQGSVSMKASGKTYDDDKEYRHMNGEFGARLVQDALPLFEARLGSA